MIKLDTKKVPIPSDSGIGRNARYQFAQMKVGDSFTLDAGAPAHVVRSAACYYSRVHKGVKFTVRTIDGGGYRVWRIA